MNLKVAKPNFAITCFSKKNICVLCKMLRAVCLVNFLKIYKSDRINILMPQKY